MSALWCRWRNELSLKQGHFLIFQIWNKISKIINDFATLIHSMKSENFRFHSYYRLIVSLNWFWISHPIFICFYFMLLPEVKLVLLPPPPALLPLSFYSPLPLLLILRPTDFVCLLPQSFWPQQPVVLVTSRHYHFHIFLPRRRTFSVCNFATHSL